MTAVFQRTLNAIQSQRAHLGNQADIQRDCRVVRFQQPQQAASPAQRRPAHTPEPAFVTEAEMLDGRIRAAGTRTGQGTRSVIPIVPLEAPLTGKVEVQRLLRTGHSAMDCDLHSPQPLVAVVLGDGLRPDGLSHVAAGAAERSGNPGGADRPGGRYCPPDAESWPSAPIWWMCTSTAWHCSAVAKSSL